MPQLMHLILCVFTSMCVIYGLAGAIGFELSGNVLYLEVTDLRGSMCRPSHIAFNYTDVSTRVTCVKNCMKHTSCHNIFYDSSRQICVGCARRYYHAANADVEVNALYYRGVCDVFMVSGQYGIPDSKITMSSHYTEPSNPDLHGPKYTRLNTIPTVPGTGAWAANTTDATEYIQAEFYNVKLLTAVSTQGRPDNDESHQFVTQYQVHYSLDCNTFALAASADGTKIFPGNTDRETIVSNRLLEPVYARCVRIYAIAHNHWVSMRFDLIGCI